jgi:hypothetical protein
MGKAKTKQGKAAHAECQRNGKGLAMNEALTLGKIARTSGIYPGFPMFRPFH